MVMTDGQTMIGTQLQMANGNAEIAFGAAQILAPIIETTSLIQEQLDGVGSQRMDFVMKEPESTGVEEPAKDSTDGVTDDAEVSKWLPPPTTAKCSVEQQDRIINFLKICKRYGKTFNAEVRNKKEYRNPDFLRHTVTYQDIDEIGSCFGREVFHPHGYDRSDFYDEIEADMKHEESKKNQKAEFIARGAQSGAAAHPPNISIPVPALPSLAGGRLRPVSASVNSTTRNKKSKWDKLC